MKTELQKTNCETHTTIKVRLLPWVAELTKISARIISIVFWCHYAVVAFAAAVRSESFMHP